MLRLAEGLALTNIGQSPTCPSPRLIPPPPLHGIIAPGDPLLHNRAHAGSPSDRPPVQSTPPHSLTGDGMGSQKMCQTKKKRRVGRALKNRSKEEPPIAWMCRIERPSCCGAAPDFYQKKGERRTNLVFYGAGSQRCWKERGREKILVDPTIDAEEILPVRMGKKRFSFRIYRL